MSGAEISAILLGCLSRDLSRVNGDTPRQLELADWESILAEAGPQGVMPLLCHRLQTRNFLHLVPDEIQKRLEQAYQATALRNLTSYGELRRLAAAAHERQIPLIVLKGAYLIDAIYDNIAVRPMKDIDLLTPPGCVDDLVACLQSLDFAPIRNFIPEVEAATDRHIPMFVNKHGVGFEVHWHIIKPGRAGSIDVAELWQRAIPVRLARADVLAFSHEDLLLYLCWHVSRQHQFAFGLRPFCDLAETIHRVGDELDWPVVIERAQRWGWSRGVFLALYLAQEMLGADVPPSVLTRLKPDDFDPGLADVAKAQVFTNHLFAVSMSEDYSQMWSGGDARDRLRHLSSRLFPPRQIMAKNYPVTPDSARVYLYYPVRMKDLAARYGRMTWQLLRGESATVGLIERKQKLSAWLEEG